MAPNTGLPHVVNTNYDSCQSHPMSDGQQRTKEMIAKQQSPPVDDNYAN